MTTIFEQENSKLGYKSLKKAIGKSANLTDLAKTCVCFANAQGGYIVIGVEDKDRLPPLGQKIEQNGINELIKKLRTLTDSVAMTQNIKPSLKTMEEHKVKALIAEDLKIHPKSKMAEIHTRFDEFTIEYIRKIVYKMVKNGIVEPFGEKKNKTYSMANKK